MKFYDVRTIGLMTFFIEINKKLYLLNKWQVDGSTLIGYIQIESLPNIEREHLCKYKI